MVPDWALKLDWDLIREKASVHQLEPELIAAVIQTETGGNTFAVRFERNYKYTFAIQELAEQIGCTVDTMERMQKTSYGLMQVMGAVAYEHGLLKEEEKFSRWPTALTLPSLGIEYGCRHLKRRANIHGDDAAAIYAAYNAGSVVKTAGGFYINQIAVDRFYSFYRALK